MLVQYNSVKNKGFLTMCFLNEMCEDSFIEIKVN